jgi:minor extracellular serine protease Vpr
MRIPLTLVALALMALPVHAQNSVAVVNAASFQPQFPVSPGCWASAFADFAASGVANTVAEVVPFPTMLGGVQVFVNDVAAPMNFAGADHINFLVPKATPEGRATIRVEVSGMVTHQGTMNVFPISPALISVNPGDETKPGAVLNQDNTLNTEANPARRGEIVQIYGLGADFSELPDVDGAEAPTDRLIETTSTPKAYVSVLEAPVQFSGLAPGLVNAWQLNLVLPENASIVKGQVPVIAEISGLTTNLVSIWVAQ